MDYKLVFHTSFDANPIWRSPINGPIPGSTKKDQTTLDQTTTDL